MFMRFGICLFKERSQDMIHRLFFHEGVEYDDEAGVVLREKGNRILLWSDEEEGSQEEMTGSGRPGESEYERTGKGQDNMSGHE